MNFKVIFKLFMLAFTVVMFSLLPTVQADDEVSLNSLSQIVIDKPIDNSYELNLFFKNPFKGNAFLQKRKNGSFYVYIPDTVMSSKKIKVVYKNKVNKSDVKINIEEQPFIKEDLQSSYLRLSVDTPVNSEIQLMAQTIEQSANTSSNNPFVNIYFVMVALLLGLILALSISIFKAMQSIGKSSNSYTSFPASFSYSSDENTVKQTVEQEHPIKIDIDTKMISPISVADFRCFDLPLKKDDKPMSISSAVNNSVSTPSLEDRTIQSKTTNPIKKQIVRIEEEPEIDLPNAEDSVQSAIEESYRPELISELKIGSNKGFYLTTVADNTFALFAYVGEKIFFLQKFTNMEQTNIQARLYDNKDGNDFYIVRLDTYKAMLSVNDEEIKEVAVI